MRRRWLALEESLEQSSAQCGDAQAATVSTRRTPTCLARTGRRASPTVSMYVTMLIRVRVVAEVVDDIAPTDAEHRAERHDGAEPELALGPVEARSAAPRSLLTNPEVPGRAIRAANVAFSPVVC